jgi:hypothetical protein
MVAAAGPAAFRKLRAQTGADFRHGMYVFQQYLVLLYLLGLLALVVAYRYNDLDAFLMDAAARLGVEDYHRLLPCFWGAVFAVLATGVVTYVLNWVPITLVALWQRRYTRRLLDETSLLWVYAMADQTGAPLPPPTTRWHCLLVALHLRQLTAHPARSTLHESLTKLVLRFDQACRRVGRRGAPGMLPVMQWLIFYAIPLFFLVAEQRFLDRHLYSSPCASPLLVDRTWLADPSFPRFIGSFYLTVLTGTAVQLAFQMGRRIGIRQALLQYLWPVGKTRQG